MNNEFVSYEIALELKELGFNEPCIAYYNGRFLDFKIWNDDGCEASQINVNMDVGQCPNAPTFSQVFRWFREQFNWQASIEATKDQHSRELGYNYWIWNSKTGEEYNTMPQNCPSGDWEFKTYEEAEIACLIKLIEINS